MLQLIPPKKNSPSIGKMLAGKLQEFLIYWPILRLCAATFPQLFSIQSFQDSALDYGVIVFDSSLSDRSFKSDKEIFAILIVEPDS